MSSTVVPDEEFRRKQQEAREEINLLDANIIHDEPERKAFFNAVYQMADGDPVKVPWADLAAKDKLIDWLKTREGSGKSAIDVACGLGDNAEALADAGYQTTGFDVAADAISWAKKRFPNSGVAYQHADLFDLPVDWNEAFDLVHECYTLQALPAEMFDKASKAVAALVKPGGALLIYTRTLPETLDKAGPPWPLVPLQTSVFTKLGFDLVSEDNFTINRRDRRIAHGFYEWRKNRSNA